MLFDAVGPPTLPTSPTSPRDVVLEMVQEVPPTVPATFGDPHLYTRGASRIRPNAGPGRSPRMCAPFDSNPTDRAYLVVVAGVDSGVGSRVTPLVEGNEDRRFHVSSASTWTPECGDVTKSECVPL